MKKPKVLKEMQLTKNFSLAELTASQIASRNNIDNTPNDIVLENLRRTATLLQKIRDHFNTPIFVSSGYRCEKLNSFLSGSSKTSQHVLGCAADFKVSGKQPREVVEEILRTDIVFDQVIEEYHPNGWVHISVTNDPKDTPRMRALRINYKGTSMFN